MADARGCAGGESVKSSVRDDSGRGPGGIRAHRLNMAWLVAAALVVLCTARAVRAGDVAEIVPADVMVYAHARDLGGMADALGRSWPGRVVAKEPMLRAARDALAGGLRFSTLYFGDLAMEDVAGYLGRQVGAVLLQEAAPNGRPHWAVIADLGDRAEAFETALRQRILPRLAVSVPKMRLNTRSHEGVALHSLLIPQGPEIWCGVVAGRLCVGSERALERVVAVHKGKERPLSQSDDFEALRARLDVPSGAMLYVNLAPVWARMEKEEWGADPHKRREAQTLGLISLRAYGMSSQPAAQGGLYESKFVLHGHGRLSGLLGAIAGCAPAPLECASILPEGYDLYAALSFSSAEALVQALKGMVRTSEGEGPVQQFDAGVAEFQKMFGADFKRDVLDPIGNEMFVAAQLPDVARMLAQRRKPRPWSDIKILVGLEAKDADRLFGTAHLVLLSEPLAGMGFDVTSVQVGGTPVHVVSLAARPNFRPAYAKLGRYVVFSLAADTVKEAAAAQAANVLAASERHRAPMQGMPPQAVLRIYADPVPELSQAIDALPALNVGQTRLKPMLPVLKNMAAELPALALTATSEDGDVVGKVMSPAGGPFWFSAVCAFGALSRSTVERRVELAKERMKSIIKALRGFARNQHVYPALLADLVPVHLRALPEDPFAKGDEAAFGYRSFGTPGHPGSGWILVSRGPDGKFDVPLDTLDAAAAQELHRAMQRPPPGDLSKLKALMYQFQKGRHADEKSEQDEGDIVRIEMK